MVVRNSVHRMYLFIAPYRGMTIGRALRKMMVKCETWNLKKYLLAQSVFCETMRQEVVRWLKRLEKAGVTRL